jgi:hypothetical protein
LSCANHAYKRDIGNFIARVRSPEGIYRFSPVTESANIGETEIALYFQKYVFIHTYHSRFIPEGVAEVSEIFLRDTHNLPKLVSYEDVTGGKPIAVSLQSISGVSAINPLVAFYDIHGGKREVLFFYFVPDTTRDMTFLCNLKILKCMYIYIPLTLDPRGGYPFGDQATNVLNNKRLRRRNVIVISENNFYQENNR